VIINEDEMTKRNVMKWNDNNDNSENETWNNNNEEEERK